MALLICANYLPAQNTVQQLVDEAEDYRTRDDITNTIATLYKAVDAAGKNNADLAHVYAQLSRAFVYTDSFLLAKKASDSAMLAAELSADNIAKARALMSKSYLSNNLSERERAIDEAQQGLRLLQKKNEPFTATILYYIIYGAYSDWNNTEKMNEYARLTLQNAGQTGDKNLLLNALNAVSVGFEYRFFADSNKVHLDSMLHYLKEAVALYKLFPGKVSEQNYSRACLNTANYYFKYFSPGDKRARDSALHYTMMAKNAVANVQNNQAVLANVFGLLSEYAKRDGKSGLTEAYLLQALQILQTEKAPYYYSHANVLQSLATFYEEQLDLKNALFYHKKLDEVNQKLFDQQQILNTQKLEVQYETEKKNSELLVLKERAEARRLQNHLYIGIAAALFTGLIFMFRAYYFKLKYSQEREKELHYAKQEAQMLMQLEKEEQARLRAEQQLLETQQQQLQKEMMASALQLEHKNEVLQNIKEKINDGDPVKAKRLLNEELINDEDFENAKLHIQKVHPDFFNKLNSKARQKLTTLDLKYCAYLHLKMNTKQIAHLLHVEPKSVRMTKYRLKQKLGLGKDDDLDACLQNMR